MPKSIKERAERNSKIRRTVAKIEQTVKKLERMKDEYLQKAVDAKARGDSASYALSKSGLNVTLSQIKRANEMLLNIEITSELQKMGEVNSDFLTGMSVIAKRIGKINKQSDFVKLQKEIEKALSGMEEAQAGLDVFLQSTDAQFAAISQSEGALSDKQIDALVDGKVSEREILMDAGIDRLFGSAKAATVAVGGESQNEREEQVAVGSSATTPANNDNKSAAVAVPFPSPNGRFVFEKKPSRAASLEVLGAGDGNARVVLSDVLENCDEPCVVIGRNEDGDVVRVKLSDCPAILVGGAGGTGKSAFLHQAVCSLALTQSAEDIRLLFIDLYNEELPCYNGLPHAVSDAITEAQGVLPTLEALSAEIERRYDVTAPSGGHIALYNKSAADKLPYIVVVIDELGDVLKVDGAERALCAVLRQAAAAGVYVIAATRNIDGKAVTPSLSALMPTRVAFYMGSRDRAAVFGASGAETGFGEAEFIKDGKLEKCVVPHVNQNEIARVMSALGEDRI